VGLGLGLRVWGLRFLGCGFGSGVKGKGLGLEVFGLLVWVWGRGFGA
jgi:hypothetical protein